MRKPYTQITIVWNVEAPPPHGEDLVDFLKAELLRLSNEASSNFSPKKPGFECLVKPLGPDSKPVEFLEGFNYRIVQRS